MDNYELCINNDSEGVKPAEDLQSNISGLYLTCYYCGTKIHSDKIDQRSKTNLFLKDRHDYLNLRSSKTEDTCCPKCSKKLPSCSVCLFPIEVSGQTKITKIGIINSLTDLRKGEGNGKNSRYIWCTRCRHGGHLDHYTEWFKTFLVCPFSECNCRCFDDKVVEK